MQPRRPHSGQIWGWKARYSLDHGPVQHLVTGCYLVQHLVVVGFV